MFAKWFTKGVKTYFLEFPPQDMTKNICNSTRRGPSDGIAIAEIKFWELETEKEKKMNGHYSRVSMQWLIGVKFESAWLISEQVVKCYQRYEWPGGAMQMTAEIFG